MNLITNKIDFTFIRFLINLTKNQNQNQNNMNKLFALLFCLISHLSICQDLTWKADSFEKNKIEGFAESYFHKEKQALAVNPIKFPAGTAVVEREFNGEDGNYKIRLTSLLETDGESFYAIFVNDIQIKEFQNPETEIDYLPNYFYFNDVKIKKGDKIKITFKNHSNGKIPEGNGFAFARARWTELVFYKSEKQD